METHARVCKGVFFYGLGFSHKRNTAKELKHSKIMAEKIYLNDIVYVSDGRIRRADIVVEGELISQITDKEEIDQAQLIAYLDERGEETSVVLPGVIDDHVHTREPGLTHKGDLASETHAAAAGGVTSIMDMPNVTPQTTTLEALEERQAMGAAHAFVNYAFHFGATNSNAHLLPQLDATRVPAVKLFMGSSTGGMLVDHGDALRAVFERSPLPIMVHCEDSAIIAENMRLAKERYGDDPDVVHHAEIRSREACIASSTLAVKLARETGARLHIAHVTTKEELRLATRTPSPLHLCSAQRDASHLKNGENDYQSGIDNNSLQNIPPSPFRGSGEGVCTLEACLPHLLFTSDDYARLGTRIKCNPSVKTAADREALREALNDGRIAVVATDHAPHLLAEKQGGCARAASGMPMVQFSLVAMLQLADEGVLSLPRLVELMCHAPARLFAIEGRGFIREGMKADLALVCRKPWALTARDIVSRCAWSPLEGRSFNWRVSQTYCNGRLIYDKGAFANDNEHACALTFSAER